MGDRQLPARGVPIGRKAKLLKQAADVLRGLPPGRAPVRSNNQNSVFLDKEVKQACEVLPQVCLRNAVGERVHVPKAPGRETVPGVALSKMVRELRESLPGEVDQAGPLVEAEGL